MKPYPLEALQKLREKERDDAAGELARQAREKALRERALAAVQATQAEVSERAQKTHEQELARSQGEGANAVDFHRLGAYRAGVQRELLALQQREKAEQKRVDEARVQEQVTRVALHQKDAEARVVAKHRTTFEAEQRKRDELRTEEEAADVHSARRRV